MDLASQWPLATGFDVRDELITAYGSTSRGYHDQRHLWEVLERLNELAAHTEFDRVPVSLAAWFHDGIYDAQPHAEERSAAWAAAALPLCAVPGEQVLEVARLVRLTAHHRPEPGDANGCALSDADLAILASDAGRYDEYVADVRREYAEIPEILFAQGRAAILTDLLAKPTLFHTSYAVEAWERRARLNVASELAQLVKRQGG